MDVWKDGMESSLNDILQSNDVEIYQLFLNLSVLSSLNHLVTENKLSSPFFLGTLLQQFANFINPYFGSSEQTMLWAKNKVSDNKYPRTPTIGTGHGPGQNFFFIIGQNSQNSFCGRGNSKTKCVVSLLDWTTDS